MGCILGAQTEDLHRCGGFVQHNALLICIVVILLLSAMPTRGSGGQEGIHGYHEVFRHGSKWSIEKETRAERTARPSTKRPSVVGKKFHVINCRRIQIG